MTVENQIPYQSYIANGTQTSFALSFFVEDKGNFVVKNDGQLVTVNDYVHDTATNSIRFNIVPSKGCLIEVERETSADRSVTYSTTNNSFRPEVLNYDIDRIWRRLQELAYTDSVLFFKLAREIAERMAGDENLQNQIDGLENRVSQNTLDIAENKKEIDELVANLSQEIADRIQADSILKEMFLSIVDTAIDEGTVNALAIMHTDSVEGLNAFQGWEGRKIYVKDKGIYTFDDINKIWTVLDKNIVRTVATISDLLALNVWQGRTINVKSFYADSKNGGGTFTYNPAYKSINDGGLVLLGWVRQNKEQHNVNMFGAYGDWNATAQTGHDDTNAFQKYASYLMTYENNPREGGSRVMRVLAGNYRLKGFIITQRSAYWSFNLIGEGQLSQLWFDPTGEGIILGQENTEIKNITLNGMLKPKYPDEDNPSIDYIIRAKLENKFLDVDLTCDGVFVCWYRSFARVAGRGFTFRNGGAGMGGEGGLCEIACDSDLIVAGSELGMHTLENSMRHFKISNSRFDVNSNLFTITGSHALKDYINGLTITNNELTLSGTLVKSLDCKLISPIFSNNLAIASFMSSKHSGVIDVPKASNVKDINNVWSNQINENNVADSRAKGISFIHRYTDVDGLLISGTTAKDLVFGLIRTTGLTKNINITDNTLNGFGDLQDNSVFLESNLDPINVKITNNTISSKLNRPKLWSKRTLNREYVIRDNRDENSCFPIESIPYTPIIRIGGSTNEVVTSARYGIYTVEGSYISATFSIAFTTTATTGAITMNLPVVAVADFTAISSFISGVGIATSTIGFTQPCFRVEARASTEQQIIFKVGDTALDISTKVAGAGVLLNGTIKYKFK